MSGMARPVPPVLRSDYGLVVSTDCQWFLVLVYSSLVEDRRGTWIYTPEVCHHLW